MTTQTTPPLTGIPVSTSITAGSGGDYIERQHAEGIVVSTGLAAGARSGYQSMQHAEGLVR